MVDVDRMDAVSKSLPLANVGYGLSLGVRGMLLLSLDSDGLEVGGEI
jgi:hypothetical protein